MGALAALSRPDSLDRLDLLAGKKGTCLFTQSSLEAAGVF